LKAADLEREKEYLQSKVKMLEKANKELLIYKQELE
jgi:hypothetical protein